MLQILQLGFEHCQSGLNKQEAARRSSQQSLALLLTGASNWSLACSIWITKKDLLRFVTVLIGSRRFVVRSWPKTSQSQNHTAKLHKTQKETLVPRGSPHFARKKRVSVCAIARTTGLPRGAGIAERQKNGVNQEIAEIFLGLKLGHPIGLLVEPLKTPPTSLFSELCKKIVWKPTRFQLSFNWCVLLRTTHGFWSSPVYGWYNCITIICHIPIHLQILVGWTR